MVNGWKVLGIVFLTLFIIENATILWWVNDTIEESDNEYLLEIECLYDFCSGNEQAYYENGVCECYDLDLYGFEILNKSVYLK